MRQHEGAGLICFVLRRLPGSARSGYVCAESVFNDGDCRRSLRTFLCVLRKEGSSSRGSPRFTFTRPWWAPDAQV